MAVFRGIWCIEPAQAAAEAEGIVATVGARKAVRDELAEHVEAYLAAGGKVREVPPGATGIKDQCHFSGKLRFNRALLDGVRDCIVAGYSRNQIYAKLKITDNTLDAARAILIRQGELPK